MNKNSETGHKPDKQDISKTLSNMGRKIGWTIATWGMMSMRKIWDVMKKVNP